MSFFAAMPIIGKIIGGPVQSIIDKMGEEDRREFEHAMARVEGEMIAMRAQIEVNATAAQHPSIFVAGARPAILWICALGIAGIMAGYIAAIFQIPFTNIDMQAMEMAEGFIFMLAIPLLGIGTLRTAEKFKGVARNSMK